MHPLISGEKENILLIVSISLLCCISQLPTHPPFEKNSVQLLMIPLLSTGHRMMSSVWSLTSCSTPSSLDKLMLLVSINLLFPSALSSWFLCKPSAFKYNVLPRTKGKKYFLGRFKSKPIMISKGFKIQN